MKRLIYALTLVGASLVLASSGFAQGPGRPGQGGPGGMRGGANFMAMMKQREDKMFAQLNLNPHQKHLVDAARNEREAGMKKMMASVPAGGRPQRGMFKPIRDAYDGKLKSILTPAQFAKLDALRKEARSKMGGPGGGRPGGGGPGRPPGK